ncbi:DVU3141 family protein [uncultured Thiocystis sp.]|uniref:DVU3141 family protein n=1 Tax=uncultured Thiocystis sp. TaxID=1202134 RepID=UPI0025DFE52B|nr:DVU3141 family protein [uncultured Thiocystis sp.]
MPCILFMAGCAGWPSTPFGVNDGTASEQIVDFQLLLSREPAETLIWLPKSPWGSDRHVLLHEKYAAASGINCRRLTIDPEGQAFPALACQSSKGKWGTVRLLQVDGRPVLSAGAVSTQTWGSQ